MTGLILSVFLVGQPQAPKPPQAPPVREVAEKPKSKRVKVSGYWFDELPGGRLQWCVECNGPYPAEGIPGLVVVNWNGYKPAAQGVAVPPFQPGTIAPGAVAPSTRFPGGWAPSIRTPAVPAGRFGGTSGCVTGYG